VARDGAPRSVLRDCDDAGPLCEDRPGPAARWPTRAGRSSFTTRNGWSSSYRRSGQRRRSWRWTFGTCRSCANAGKDSVSERDCCSHSSGSATKSIRSRLDPSGPSGTIYGYTPDWGQLPPLDEGPLEHAAQPAPMSARGRRTKRVSVYEANVAARIYVQDRASYDAREDGGAYAVHTLYIEDREPSSALLSRPMVGHLLHAIREGWLPWDARKKRLRILNEFRTSNSMLVIPRSKPAS
jgi:hypothetical protein